MTGEFDFIRSLLDRTANQKSQFSSVKIGIGDDCAVISQNLKTDLVITTDLLVEDVDFRLDWTTAEFLGHKALAVSLSDVASMGAKPQWALVSIGVPEKIWKTDFVEKFYAGWFALARRFNVELAGGDVSRTPDKIVIDSIVAGSTKKNQAILRSGAAAGDLIFVTGKLGGAAAGLRLLENNFRFADSKGLQKKLLRRQLIPDPQIELGLILSEENLATAMIDLSDGLSSDLAHLCQSSQIGAEIELETIPLERNVPRNILNANEDKFSLALNGGEDFELLFTVKPQNINKLKNLLGERITLIGEITVNVGKIELVSGSKKALLEPKGFRHF